MAETSDRKKNKKYAESLAENAYHILRNKIMQGMFPPGETMLEESLSASLGMSRTPIRTALTKLESEGLLAEGSDRTLRVPKLDDKILEDTFRARITIETAIASLAAECATKEQIERLEHLMWDEEMANKSKDEALVSGLDRMFHTYLAEITDNSYFIDFSTRINARVSLLLAQSNTLSDAVIPAIAEHTRIVNAIKNKDPINAESAMREHLTEVINRIKTSLSRKLCKAIKLASGDISDTVLELNQGGTESDETPPLTRAL
jgi:DNA-binding GntR family transcriptional regulator